MLAEIYLKARYFQGRADALADNNRAWWGWLQRKEAAEREGLPFAEPPPDKVEK